MGVAGLIFEPRPPNFENQYNFWRCLNGIKTFFYISAKGQIFSKCLIGAFTFSQKTNENKSTSSKDELFRSFFGRKWKIYKTFWKNLTFSISP